MVEEGEVVDIDGRDPFPFLQGIEDLLRTPMRNMVIEEMCGGLEDKCKGILKDKGKFLEEKEVACVLSWCEDVPPATKLIKKPTTYTSPLGEEEGKWKTQRR